MNDFSECIGIFWEFSYNFENITFEKNSRLKLLVQPPGKFLNVKWIFVTESYQKLVSFILENLQFLKLRTKNKKNSCGFWKINKFISYEDSEV